MVPALFINSRKVGEGRIAKIQGAVWSLGRETADVGRTAHSPATDDYAPWENAFIGMSNARKVAHES